MKATASFKKFFSSSLNILIQNQYNQKYYYNKSIQKIEKELENKETLLTEKKNRFRQANNEFKNCTRGFEILEDTLLITKEKQKARRLINEINPLINRRLNLSRKIEILQWEINNLSNIIEKRRIQYLQLKFDQCELYPEKNVLQQQLNNLLLQPVTIGF
jgi:chromosome segregation ATPase